MRKVAVVVQFQQNLLSQLRQEKKGVIEVQYNMNPGPISKTITVETNAVNKENGMVALRIKGTVLVKEEKSILEKKAPGPLSR